jgi:ABC-type molybdate transport system ATPase subunit
VALQTQRGRDMNLRFSNVSLRLNGFTLDLDLALDKKVTALFGSSGAGKTTVLELVAGLKRPDRGAIELDGVTLVDVSRGVFAPARNRAIGYIPQGLALFPHLSVRNVVYGLKKEGAPGLENLTRKTVPRSGNRAPARSNSRFDLCPSITRQAA